MAILDAIGRRARVGLLLALTLCGAAAQSNVPEYQLKAVYLVKFAEFVDWPALAFSSSDSPLVIGVLGTESFWPGVGRGK